MVPVDNIRFGEMGAGGEQGERPRHAEPGLGLFAGGALLGAVIFPVLVTRSESSRLLPGVSDPIEATVTCCLVAVAVAGVACLCFLLGRKVLEQRRIPCRWCVPLAVFLVLGASVPAAFLGIIAFTDWSNRIVGLPWGLAVGLPFLFGAYVGVSGPRPDSDPEQGTEGGPAGGT